MLQKISNSKVLLNSVLQRILKKNILESDLFPQSLRIKQAVFVTVPLMLLFISELC